jgi:hypothetical protein
LEDKAKDKAANGKGKKINLQDEVTSTVLDEVSQPKLASNRGTKWESSHLSIIKEHLTLDPIVVDIGDNDDVSVDELIINSSLTFFILKDGPKSQAFHDVVSFIEKVMHF